MEVYATTITAGPGASLQPPEPSDDEVREYVRRQWMPILVRRSRAASFILVFGTLAFTLSALATLPIAERGIIRVHFVHAAAQTLLFFVVGRAASGSLQSWLPAAGAIATTWIVAYGATMVGHTVSTALVVSGYLMGVAALMPWGLPQQVVVVALAILAFAGNVYALTGGIFFTAGYYVSVPVLLMAGTSLYVSHDFERSRFETAREELRRIRAEEALKAANSNLEVRVEERTRELRQVVEELRSFSYTISHDLRSPLRAINGFSQTLADDFGEVLGASGLAGLERVRAASRRMGEMIDAMLGLGRVTSSPIRRVSIDLSSLALSVAQALDRAAPSRKVEWSVEPGMRVEGDAILVQMLLENLLGNAHKFTAQIAVPRVAIGTDDRNGAPAYFVRDNGPGFDMAHTRHLFEEFHRLHHPDQFEGSGIGLAVVRRVVERHGGRVWAEAKPGQGATFFFTLAAGHEAPDAPETDES
ncbi:MAG: hypothetical protein HY899_03405 [Deltaproteobacteria bacterium]|nr:hypothetical protein [Deltaproteobacteria bacterium]